MKRTYGGWQRADQTFMLGLSGLQAIGLAVAGLGFVVGMSAHSAVKTTVLLGVAGVVAVMSLIKIAGRPPLAWSGLVASLAINQVFNATEFQATPIADVFKSGGGAMTGEEDGSGEEDRTQLWELPGVLAPLRHLAARDSTSGSVVGIIHNAAQGTYSAVALLRHSGLGLLDDVTQEARVAGWSRVLAQQCLDEAGISRISVYHHAEPGETQALLRWFEAHARPSAPGAAVELTRGIIEAGATTTVEHRTYLVITMSVARSKREIRAAGGGDDGACAVLLRHCASLASGLLSAGARVDEWLTPRHVAEMIKEAFAPDAKREHDVISHLERNVDDVFRVSGPQTTNTRWGRFDHDGYSSVAWEIAFPQIGRDATMLAPLVTASPNARRALSLHFEPVDPRTAQRTISQERTKRAAGLAIRAKAKQIPTAAERKGLSEADRQDEQLANGAGLVRFCGYVAVTVPDEQLLDRACDQMRADASAAGVELRRAAGWLDTAFVAAVVPVGIGLKGKGQGLG